MSEPLDLNGLVEIGAFRLVVLRKAIELEVKGLQRSRRPSALTIAKRELGLDRYTPTRIVLEALDEKIQHVMDPEPDSQNDLGAWLDWCARHPLTRESDPVLQQMIDHDAQVNPFHD